MEAYRCVLLVQYRLYRGEDIIMVQIKMKDKARRMIEPLFEQDSSVDNALELLKYTSQVQSRIKKDITSDFTLAKLSDKDKEGITELTVDAYFAKKVLSLIANKAQVWDYNNETKVWVQHGLPDVDRKAIYGLADTTFDAFMNRIYMTVILSRNVDKNYLISVLARAVGSREEEVSKTEETKPESLFTKLKKKVTKKEEEE